jgi:hypothetical protein
LVPVGSPRGGFFLRDHFEQDCDSLGLVGPIHSLREERIRDNYCDGHGVAQLLEFQPNFTNRVWPGITPRAKTA